MDGNGCFGEKTVSIIIQISRRMWVKLFHMPQRQCHIITTVSQFKSDIHQIQNYSTAVHQREHKIFTGSFK